MLVDSNRIMPNQGKCYDKTKAVKLVKTTDPRRIIWWCDHGTWWTSRLVFVKSASLALASLFRRLFFDYAPPPRKNLPRPTGEGCAKQLTYVQCWLGKWRDWRCTLMPVTVQLHRGAAGAGFVKSNAWLVKYQPTCRRPERAKVSSFIRSTSHHVSRCMPIAYASSCVSVAALDMSSARRRVRVCSFTFDGSRPLLTPMNALS